MNRVVDWLRKPWLQLALVLLVATAFRIWALNEIPPGLFGDEAAEGLDALDVLAGRGQVFFPTNYGREGLYIWLVAGSIGLFGVSPVATRLPAVILGIATCGLAWWMTREMARLVDAEGRPAAAGEKPGPSPAADYLPLMVGLFLATAFWHVLFSRFSQRTILTPFAIALCVAAFWRGMNTGRLRWFALAGVGMGLALHSYSVGRFLPVFMALFLLLQWLVGRRTTGSVVAVYWRGVLLMFAIAAIVFSPLGYYFITHPGSFFQRASAVATYAGGSAGETLSLLARSALANLAQYVVPGAGDRAQFHNLPGRPVFDFISSIFALVGLAVCIRWWKRPLALFLLLWLGVMTLPAVLATDRYPTLPRVLGVLPGLYLLPAIGAAWVANRKQAAPAQLLVLAALVLLPASVISARDYFGRWGRAPATYFAFEGDMTDAADWVTRNDPSGHIYLSTDIYRHPTYMYLAERATVTGYFDYRDPNLSWFDARYALPLPSVDEPATYVISSSAQPAEMGAELLASAKQIEQVEGPGDLPSLFVLRASGDLHETVDTGGAVLYEQESLALLHVNWSTGQDGKPLLVLTWRTAGPVAEDWGGYRLRVTAGERSVDLPFDAFRAPEWVAGGEFITWHTIDWPDRPSDLTFSVE